MKSPQNLYERVIRFDNLYYAYREALAGKRSKTGPAQFMLNLSQELIQLQRSLETHTYQPGKYTTFYIYEPKKRMISAAPFRDRVVHHAICRVIEPIFEKSFIYDSYACRKGKGT